MIPTMRKRLLALFVMLAIASSLVTVTMPVYATEATLWSQDFEGITDTPWPVNFWRKTRKTVDGVSVALTPEEQAVYDAYSDANSVKIVDGKLVVTKNQMVGTHIDTDYIRMEIPLSGAFTTPESGYLGFEFDYKQSENWIDSNPYVPVCLLNSSGKNITGMCFGSQDYGLRLLPGNASQYTTKRENVGPSTAYVGKSVHIQVLYDLERDKVTVFYTPENGVRTKATLGEIDIPTVSAGTLDSGGFDLAKIRLTFACNNTTQQDGAPIVMELDNFAVKTYENPTITQVNVLENEENVSVNREFYVTFDKPIDYSTTNNITLKAGDTAVNVMPSLSADGKTVTIAHPRLAENTAYVLTVPTAVTSTNGVGLVSDSVYNFTTGAYDPVLWSYDFATPPQGVALNTPVSGWYKTDWNVYVANNEFNAENNYLKFDGDKLQLVKIQNTNTGNILVNKVLDTKDMPTTGGVSFEYDYTIEGLKINSYQPIFQIRNADNQEMVTLNFGDASWGVWDATGLNFNYDNAQKGEILSGEQAAVLADGQPIHIKVLIDFDNKNYDISLTHNGVTYRNPNGSQKLPELTTNKIKQISFYSYCNGGNYPTTNTSTVDNAVLKTIDYVVPAIASSSVENNKTEVVLDKPLAVQFTTPMDLESLSDVKLYQGSLDGTEIALTPSLSSDGMTASFNHEKLTVATTYYLVIPSTVKSSTEGYLESTVTYPFTTVLVEPIKPEIISANAPDGATGIGLTEPQKIVFSTEMNFSTLSNVKMYEGTINGKQVPLTPSLSTDNRAAYFAHSPLKYDTNYVMVIPTTVRSMTNGIPDETVITFTTIKQTIQHENVLWFEDFDYRTGWDKIEGRAGWSSLLRETVDGVNTGYSTFMGDRDNTDRAKLEFREGGIYFTTPQNSPGGYNDYINITVPFTGYQATDSDYVAIEFEFYQDKPFKSKYSGDITIKNADSKNLVGINFGSESYGFQDSTVGGLEPSSFVNYPEFYTYLTKLDTNKNNVINAHEIPTKNIGVLSDYINKDVKVQVLFDMKNKKYIVNYTTNGERKVASSGWTDFIPGYNYDLYKITIASNCAKADADTVHVKYDNIAVVEYNNPKIDTISTPNGANDVAVDEPITINFTEKLMESTIDKIVLVHDDTPITITSRELSADGKTVTLNHNGLAHNTAYKLTIPTTVLSKDYLSLKTEANYEFTTVSADAKPVVREVSFEDGQTDFSRTEDLSVTFSKQMNFASLSNITLSDGVSNVPLAVSLINNNKTAVFSHGELSYGTQYTLTIPTTVKATDNTAVASDITYRFTTVDAPTKPIIMYSSITDDETGVPVNKEFVITFDKAMDTSSFDDIKLMKGETPVTLTPFASNGNKTVTLGHTKLDNNTQYTLIIPTTVKSSTGIRMANEVIYTFTTAPAVEGETLLYGYYFDQAPDGSNEVKARYQGDGWDVYTYTNNTYGFADDNKIEFKGGKMVITKAQRITGGSSAYKAYAGVTLPTTKIPTTGVMSIEYDIRYKDRFKDTYQTDTYIRTDNNTDVTRFCFATEYYGWRDMTANANINYATKISANAWLEDKDIHVKVLYNLDDWTYSMYYTVEGVTYQSPLGVAKLPGSSSKKINKINWVFLNNYNDSDAVEIIIDNVEFKKLTKVQLADSTSITDGQVGVSATDRIKFAFNSAMNTEYFKDIKIYEGTVANENLVSTTAVVGEDNTSCYIYPDFGLKYNTKYVALVPTTVVSENYIPAAETRIEFTTERTTVGYGAQFISVKNIGGAEVSNIRALPYVKATVRFTNNFGSLAKEPMLVVAVCDSKGNIKKISYSQRLLLPGQSQDVTVSFAPKTPFESGDYLKAYVMDRDTLEYLSPQVSH